MLVANQIAMDKLVSLLLKVEREFQFVVIFIIFILSDLVVIM
jgi:hypothetical protein